MKKSIKILMMLMLVLLISGCKSSDKSSVLKGTYLCHELPFATMVFDPDDNYTFYYYNYELQDNQVDQGTYSMVTTSKYLICSFHFDNEEITYDAKKHIFEIVINDKTYLFERDSGIPTIHDN